MELMRGDVVHGCVGCVTWMRGMRGMRSCCGRGAWRRGYVGCVGCVEWMRGMFTQNTKLKTLAQSFEFSFSPAKQTLKCFPNLTSGRVGIGAIRGMIRKVGWT